MRTVVRVMTACAIAALVLCAAGCASTEKASKPAPAAVQPAPAPAPAPVRPAPAPAPVVRSGGLVSIGTVVAGEIVEGDDFDSAITLRASEDVSDVIVTLNIPSGLTYVKSSPAGTAQGGSVVWRFPTMGANAVEKISVSMKAAQQGQYDVCADVQATKRECYAVKVTKPAIKIEKTGPEQAMLGDDVTYQIVVSNEGDGTARGVVVVDDVPKGFVHDSGRDQLSYTVGDLPAGGTKTIVVKMKADQRGKICNTAVVDTENAGKSESTACTVVLYEDYEVTKDGIAEQYIKKNAPYTITVKNTGDTTLKNVRVTDNAPAATQIVQADGGAVAGNTASWTVDALEPGKSESFKIVLTSATLGTHENCVTVAAGAMSKQDCAATLWKGISAILLEVIDTMDPLQIGEPETYVIRVTNQGSKEDTNVKITAQFPPEIDPVSTAGAAAGSVDGKKVDFEAYPSLAPKQSITYEIRAAGKQPGDGRLKVYLNSDMLSTPVLEEESTHVY